MMERKITHSTNFVVFSFRLKLTYREIVLGIPAANSNNNDYGNATILICVLIF